jgi:hypothetical protein
LRGLPAAIISIPEYDPLEVEHWTLHEIAHYVFGHPKVIHRTADVAAVYKQRRTGLGLKETDLPPTMDKLPFPIVNLPQEQLDTDEEAEAWVRGFLGLPPDAVVEDRGRARGHRRARTRAR